MGRPRLLVLDDWEGLMATSPGVAAMREIADVRVLSTRLEDSDVDLRDVEVVVAIRERTTFDAATLDRFPSLRLILQSGGHAYHLDAAAARNRGIVVTLGRRAVGPRAAVPELTFALMVGALRRFPEAFHHMRAGDWPILTGRTLSGRRLGILGMGRHGSAVARLAGAFGMDVVAWARDGHTGIVGGVPRIPLDELFATCDVVSIHLRLSDQSRGLVTRELLESMRPGAILVNTARGAIVDEPALVEVLRSGRIGGAALDVFSVEPLPEDSPLRHLPNVLLTPHVGWTVEEVMLEFAQIAAEQLRDYLAGSLDPAELHPESIAP